MAAGLAQARAAARPPAAEPFYLAPTVESLLLCDEAAENLKIFPIEAAYVYCGKRKLDGSAALARLLDTLEPGGPKGKVQVGYTQTLKLLSLYKRGPKGWELDLAQVDTLLRPVTKVARPVVLYLAADHFDTIGPLAEELRQDKRNLMLLADGRPAASSYFGYPILPYTLQTDADIPVNRYRFAALRAIARRIAELPPQARKRIVAITLLGELHHMFPNFESGMGAYEDIRVTDYSPASVAGFRLWLRQRYGSIETFQARTGLAYDGFDAVPAPSKNIRKDVLDSFGEHYDAFADGTLPFSGWLWDPQQRIAALDLYIDGKRQGPVPRGFNRLDVYRADESVLDPNVGYRIDFDFSGMTPGRHRAQIVAESAGTRYELAQVEFVVGSRHPVPAWHRAAPAVAGLPSAQALPGVKSWLDLPRSLQDVYFNPLARDWNQYRAGQVRAFMQAFYDVAVQAGLPADKLYSHQIVPQVNSSWNPQLLAVGDTLAADTPWKPGFNLYGGATDSAWVRGFIAERRWRGYGVPEFHPQQWKRPGNALKALRSHQQAGARFVSPYYFSPVPQRFRPPGIHGVSRMELRPDNPLDGSDQFYDAIRALARE
ncbi:hypothetical protein DFQ15_11186 [Xylophilus ampelinus]|uniref:Beta-galactosidase-like protein n=2 Tax=Xylophilus ampelinus TaxID=54067 RepID=A0A318SL25_9BURK|nr:hypothetical protein DFQ15_11186 [Xylophilus ampelinus]